MTEVLIDNATIYSVCRIDIRNKNNMKIRDINVLALDNFIESYLLNDFLYIDEGYWEYLLKHTPKKWHKYYNEIIRLSSPLNIDLSNFCEFISSDIVYFLLNCFINNSSNKRSITQDFLSYTGYDFENYKISESELKKINEIMSDKWRWDYKSANLDHIDIVMMAYRTIEYISVAKKNNYNLITHPIRNEFLNEIGYLYGHEIARQYNKIVYDEMKNKIIKCNISSISNTITQLKSEGKCLWSSIKIPLFASLVYERANTIDDIFKEAYKLRIELKPFRDKINTINNYLKTDNISSVDSELKSLVVFLNNLSFNSKNINIEYSAEIGFPWSLALGISGKIETPKYLRIFTDLIHRYNLPSSYIYSCNKLFNYKMIE